MTTLMMTSNVLCVVVIVAICMKIVIVLLRKRTLVMWSIRMYFWLDLQIERT